MTVPDCQTAGETSTAKPAKNANAIAVARISRKLLLVMFYGSVFQKHSVRVRDPSVDLYQPWESSLRRRRSVKAAVRSLHPESDGALHCGEMTRRARTGTNAAMSNLGRFVQFPSAPRDFLSVRRHYTIDGSTIDGSTINGCTIRRSIIGGSTIHGSTIHGSRIHGSTVNRSTIHGSTIDGCTIIDGSAVDRCTIDRCTISGFTILGSTINRSTVSGCAMSGPTIPGRRFTRISGRNVVRCEAGRRN
jgi:hypothetical protein